MITLAIKEWKKTWFNLDLKELILKQIYKLLNQVSVFNRIHLLKFSMEPIFYSMIQILAPSSDQKLKYNQLHTWAKIIYYMVKTIQVIVQIQNKNQRTFCKKISHKLWYIKEIGHSKWINKKNKRKCNRWKELKQIDNNLNSIKKNNNSLSKLRIN